MISLATETERTLFFDFLPLSLGEIRGFKTRFHLYTVPGQVFYDASRKLILKGVDGVVFVADSQIERMEANLESVENLRINLSEQGYDLNRIPYVVQYNKRDLPNVATVDELRRLLNPARRPGVPGRGAHRRGGLRHPEAGGEAGPHRAEARGLAPCTPRKGLEALALQRVWMYDRSARKGDPHASSRLRSSRRRRARRSPRARCRASPRTRAWSSPRPTTASPSSPEEAHGQQDQRRRHRARAAEGRLHSPRPGHARPALRQARRGRRRGQGSRADNLVSFVDKYPSHRLRIVFLRMAVGALPGREGVGSRRRGRAAHDGRPQGPAGHQGHRCALRLRAPGRCSPSRRCARARSPS